MARERVLQVLRGGLLACLVAAILLPCAASAQQKSPRWTTRLLGTLVLVPNETEVISRSPEDPIPAGSGVVESVALEIGNGWGLGFGVEYRITKHLFGLELGAMAMQLDSRVTWNTDLGEVVDDDMTGAIIPITLGANFHLLRADNPADFYVAALVSWTMFDDATSTYIRGDAIQLEDSFGIGFDLGFNYAVSGGPFLINGLVRYLAPQTVARVTFEASSEEITRNLQFSPLMLSLGLGYRF